jgi:predicted deacylase
MQTQHHPLSAAGLGNARSLTSLHFGRSGGRRALLQCSLHADEIPAMLVGWHLRRRLTELEAAGRLSGEVVLLPACNPIGLGQQVWGRLQGRFDVASGQNFNRHYPELASGAAARFKAAGALLTDDAQANALTLRRLLQAELAERPAASALQQLRHRLMALALDADVVLDLHCDNEAVLHVYATPQHELRALRLAQCVQAPLLLLAQESGDGPFDEAHSMIWPRLRELLGPAVPLAGFAATVELRGETQVDHALAAADAEGLLAFLAEQGFVQGVAAPDTTPCAVRPLAGCMPLVAPSAGLLAWRVPVGREVDQGEHLADLIDPLSAECLPLRSPVPGLFFARELQRWAQAGQSVAKVAGSQALRSGKLLSA